MHEQFMQVALEEAKIALKNGEFPVGCVIADEKSIITTGRREKSALHNELDHAEIIALRKLNEQYPEKRGTGLTVYSTMEPCLMCFSTLLLNNVHTIVFSYEDVMGGGTNLKLKDLSPLYSEMSVSIISNILRDESLKLFQTFFSDPKNDYLQGSLLASYTLSQKCYS